ncbi:GGDEF domain-containing protein, partial [Cupriavidus sp. SIMBA_020]|uniref:GGDEF domain-containing protein n=1 Tax=Cupriavidus sp. SIMBA_020 TaxID=3085766 RepID=UPI0039788110
DPMTGASNRRQFIAQVEREIQRAERDGTPFCLLALDLDNFKTVNDTLGHNAGDEVLKMVAERIVANVRANDTVARMGGDEFALVLEEVDDVRDV